MKFTPSPHQIEHLAHRQLLDYQSNNPDTCFSEPGFNITVADAYHLQDAVTRLRVEDEARQNNAVVNPNEFCQLAIEGEMAIKVDEDGQIKAAFPVIELHNFIFRAAQKTLAELIANNGINAGIILPEMNWQNSTKYLYKNAQLTVFINGLDVSTTGLWPSDDGPKTSVTWLKSNLEDCGIKLKPGSIVLAGTTLGLYSVKSGDEVSVHIDKQPLVSCTIKNFCTL